MKTRRRSTCQIKNDKCWRILNLEQNSLKMKFSKFPQFQNKAIDKILRENLFKKELREPRFENKKNSKTRFNPLKKKKEI
jgi:hypothetical protein